MEPKTLLNADYLDIVFDQRNKAYGSYELRRNYGKRIKKAIGISVGCTAAIFMLSFVSVNVGEKIVVPVSTKEIHTSIVIPQAANPKPKLIIRPKASPSNAHAYTRVNSRAFTVPKISTDNQVLPTKKMSTVAAIKVSQAGPGNEDGPDIAAAPTAGNGGGTGVSAGPLPATSITVWVEQMPAFCGDINAYISSHLHYSESARELNIAGTVSVSFVVNEDGTVTNATILRGIGGGCDEEAIRMVSGMPKWKPGKQNGKAVKVLFTLSIKFELD